MRAFARLVLLSALTIPEAFAFLTPCTVQKSASHPCVLQQTRIGNPDNNNEWKDDTVGLSRRFFLVGVTFLPLVATAKTGSIQTSQYSGKTTTPGGKTKKIKPETAFENLVKARDELQGAQKSYLDKKDVEGLRDFLSHAAINDYEVNALAILSSKRLDDEDKKAIGTIRTYGAGADVMIMYGGLMSEIDENNDEPDLSSAKKYLTRTVDSLSEVISICRSGGFE